MSNTIKEKANLTDIDLTLQTLLDMDIETASVEEFETLIKTIIAAQDRWIEEETNAAAAGRKVNPNKGVKKLSPKKKEEAEEFMASMDFKDIF